MRRIAPMKRFAVIVCLAIAALPASTLMTRGADFQKGMEAYKDKDYAAAVREWLPLARQGLIEAQIKMGSLFASGAGVPQNYQEALKWFGLAAEQGSSDAQFGMGFIFRKRTDQAPRKRISGELYGVGRDGDDPANYIYAHMWFNIAGSSGHESALEARDSVAKLMTQTEIEEAQKLSLECFRRNYKEC